MTALHRDLSAPEIWQRSFERSRHRRATAPKLRRQVARRKRASTAMAAAMLAGPTAQFAGAQGPSPSTGGSGIASESPANRAIEGGNQAAQVMLSIGSAGNAVTAVQSRLGIETTGVFDEETDQAVREFQGQEGLAVDGVVGPLTWGALFGGSGTSPAADTGSGPVLVPAIGAGEQRTSFAVRRASKGDAQKLETLGADLPKPEDDGAALAAIELRLPAEEAGEEASDSGGEEAGEEASDSGGEEASDSGGEEPSDSNVQASAEARAAEDSGAKEGRVSLAVRPHSESTSDSGSTSGSSDSSGSADDPDSSVSEGDSGAGGGEDSEEPSGGSSGSEPSRGGEEESGSDRGEESTGGACSQTLKWPTTGRNITSTYGDGRGHGGVDIDGGLGDEGNPVYAAACGVISLISPNGSNGGYGNFVCVKHTDRFVTCYAHLKGFAKVREGDYVRRGQTIGYVGNTGRSFGAHLHFEVRNGTPYRSSGWPRTEDPMPYLNGRKIPGRAVQQSSGDTGGPNEEEAKQAWTAARSEPATEERSAVAIATDREEPAPATSSERRASVAAETEPAEPVAEKPPPAASEPDRVEQQAADEPPAGDEAEAGDEAQPVTKPAEEAPADTEPAAEPKGEEAPADDSSAEADAKAAEQEKPPVEEASSDKSAPATEESSGAGEEAAPQKEGEVVTDDGAESSPPTPEDPAPSNGSDPSTGEDAEQPSAGGGEGATGEGTSVEGETGPAGSDGDAGSPTSTDGSSSVAPGAGTTATVEAPASTATTGSASADAGEAQIATATAPSESAASSSNGSSDAAASDGSEASTGAEEGDSTASGTSSDASTEAYFSAEESDESEPGAGD